MAAYRREMTQKVTCGLTAWDQLWAQLLITSMGELYLYILPVLIRCYVWLWLASSIQCRTRCQSEQQVIRCAAKT